MAIQCTETGVEIWLLFIIPSILVTLFVFKTRWFIEWLRMRRVTGRYPGNAFPDVVFGPRGVWTLRLLGVIPAILWIAGAFGVYCFFHGPG
jgi:hypothetical protein